MTTDSDGALARKAASGDRAAFGAIYDRFGGEVYGFCLRLLSHREDAADVTQDVFVRAVERLPQLREPDRVRAWLFAIARHECYARTRKRSRTTPSDPMDLEFDQPSDRRSTVGTSEGRELTQLVWDAAKGLSDEDRAVLELKLRNDLDGADLADALGVPHDQLHKVVARATERFERSVVSLVLARGARKDCPELAAIVSGGSGSGGGTPGGTGATSSEPELTPTLRKRIARHVEDCDTCERRRKLLVAPSMMVASAYPATPPAGLRDRVLDAISSSTPSGTSAASYHWRSDGFPGSTARRAALLVVGALVALLLLGGVAGARLLSDSGGGSADTVVVETPTTVAAATTAPASLPPTTLPPTTLPPTTLVTTTLTPTTLVTTTLTPTTLVPTTVRTTVPPTAAATTVPVTRVVIALPPGTKPTVPPTTAPRTTLPRTTVPRSTRPPRATATNPPTAPPTTPPTAAPTVPPTLPPETTVPTTVPETSTVVVVAVTTTTAAPTVTTLPPTTTTRCSPNTAGCQTQPTPTTTTTIPLRICCVVIKPPVTLILITTTQPPILIK